MTRIADRFRSNRIAALAAVGLLAVGGGVGAAAIYAVQPTQMMAPVAPVPIASLARTAEPLIGERIVTVRGRVAEVYGGRFILADASGRALVETGRHGDDQGLVALNQVVTVQGGFDDGVVRAAFLVGADGKVTALHPHRDRHGHGLRRHGERIEREKAEPATGSAPAPSAG